MKLFSFFIKQAKPRGFEYMPRYSDPEKTAKEQRRKRIEQEVLRERGETVSDEEYVPNIRGQFRAVKEKNTGVIHKRSNRKLYIFIVVLFCAYILYKFL
ncbi:MAG: hypothetical protein M0R02_05475 [Bacteroidales bacterium]|nr:hypothetical protein [Bacteroidales bacterium]NLK80884.1 hypothetical protein [Bacteroidales bacterium]HPY82066.1 hypothetical protein [Bacteroidales bacterium]